MDFLTLVLVVVVGYFAIRVAWFLMRVAFVIIIALIAAIGAAFRGDF
jgi:hypothetical protein